MPTNPLQLKYPVILIHGLGAKSTFGPIDYFYGLPKLLREAKNRIFIPKLTPFHRIEHRAQQLKEQIESEIPEGKLNLIGHSMGGLDARYLVSQLGFKDRIASVTTIGTPNRGTSIGDIATGMLPGSAFTQVDKVLNFMESNTGAFKQITRSFCQNEFLKQAPLESDIAYFSATSAISNPVYKSALPIFWLPHRLLNSIEGDNDGFVSVESAKWGDHICTYFGDHYAQIGQIVGYSRGMDYMKFYTEIFSYLKKQGL